MFGDFDLPGLQERHCLARPLSLMRFRNVQCSVEDELKYLALFYTEVGAGGYLYFPISTGSARDLVEYLKLEIHESPGRRIIRCSAFSDASLFCIISIRARYPDRPYNNHRPSTPFLAAHGSLFTSLRSEGFNALRPTRTTKPPHQRNPHHE